MIKKIIIILIVCAAGLIWYFYDGQSGQIDFAEMKKQNPNFLNYVENAEKWQNKLAEDPERIETYTTLGLAWKSLADATGNPEYYQKALDVYRVGVEKSQRRNTLLLANAGNMARYLKDYKTAADYYREAITVAPGENGYYITLAEIYEYDMKKSKEEVLSLYEEGMKKVLNPSLLESYKTEYLERNK